MTTMPISPAVEADEVLIEMARPDDDEAAEALWRGTAARPCAQGQPVVRLVARDGKSGAFLGVADYFRTFPPEEALGGVAVVPTGRRRGVGVALLRELAGVAFRNGKRSLAGFMSEQDEAAWRLVCAAGVPVRMHQVEGGLYYELDLTPLMRR